MELNSLALQLMLITLATFGMGGTNLIHDEE